MNGNKQAELPRPEPVMLDAADVLRQMGLSRAKWLEMEHAAAQRHMRAAGNNRSTA